jgi:hypothetical protein
MRAALRFALLALLAASASAGTPPDVLVHPDHAKVPLGREELRAIFMMRTRAWPDGRPIRVFVLGDGAELHDEFVRTRLGTFPYVLRGGWDRMVFTGTGFAPTLVGSEAEMRERVLATPGAIGYARSGAAGGGAR